MYWRWSDRGRGCPPMRLSPPRRDLQAADDLREYWQVGVRSDEVGQAEALAAGLEVGADLAGAADQDGGHFPDRFGFQPAPASPGDEVLGRGAPPARGR